MDIRCMRQIVAEAYCGDKWKQRVSRMADNQVVAIYYSLQKRKSRKKSADEGTTNVRQPETNHQITLEEHLESKPEPVYHQISIFEYLEDKKHMETGAM